MDMQHGKLVIVGAPGIVIDADGLNLVFSKTKPRSDSAAVDPGLANNPEGAHERHPAGIKSGLVYRFPDEMSYPVMRQQESPYLLLRHLGLSGAENRGRSALVRLDLIEYQLSFPALVICGRQLGRGRQRFRPQPGHRERCPRVLQLAETEPGYRW